MVAGPGLSAVYRAKGGYTGSVGKVPATTCQGSQSAGISRRDELRGEVLGESGAIGLRNEAAPREARRRAWRGRSSRPGVG